MPAVRAVLDTNIFISALVGKGPSAQLYNAFRAGRFWLVTSHRLLSEVAEVLTRPKFGIDPVEVRVAFRLLRHQSLIVHPKESIRACRDPKDALVLECAVSGEADFIVTGDQDLLVLNPFRGIRIVPPSVFLKRLAV